MYLIIYANVFDELHVKFHVDILTKQLLELIVRFNNLHILDKIFDSEI